MLRRVFAVARPRLAIHLPPHARHAVARAIMADPLTNRGLAWGEEERLRLGLKGLYPAKVFTIQEQLIRVREQFDQAKEPMAKFKYLSGLQDRNETLFYRFCIENIRDVLPIIYTPTVGQVCQEYGHIFRRPRGLYISYEDRGKIKEVLENWGSTPRVIVVTDGERILGLGDLGANGMGIPVGKLSLYIACAGVAPENTLPICLDVGTNREALRKDVLYPGLNMPRVSGQPYDDFIREFVQAVGMKWPHVLLQWEDFGVDNAFRLLDEYRDKICSFNDDIQGTATVVLAALHGACRVAQRPLEDHRILFYGAGSSATGVADLISGAIARKSGCSIEEARKRCFFVDTQGLLCKTRLSAKGGVKPHKLNYCHPLDATYPTPKTGKNHVQPVAPKDDTLEAAVEALKPTALIGLSTTAKAFTPSIIQKMAQYNERPIIFALSNPTSKAECTAAEAYGYTEGRALFASGSPFDPVKLPDGRVMEPRQANNAYIFPGLGLGVTMCQASTVPDDLFHIAAEQCAMQVKPEALERGSLCPELEDIRGVSVKIAAAVIRRAVELKIHRRPAIPDDIDAWVRAKQYNPDYPK